MQLYIDESKAKSYILVAVLVQPGLAAGFRKRMMRLRMPGQRYIHFINERDSRRKIILSELLDMNIRARVYRTAGLHPIAARAICLKVLLADLIQLNVTNLVFELEESSQKSDVILLRQILSNGDLRTKIEYSHVSKPEEPLVWIADAIAWSYARGGDFRRRALLLIDAVLPS